MDHLKWRFFRPSLPYQVGSAIIQFYAIQNNIRLSFFTVTKVSLP
jgi:hypothetical protein